MKNRISKIVENLDDLPYPDRDIFDFRNLHSESEGRVTVMVSRGCPYACSYCCNSALHHLYKNELHSDKYVRFRSPQKAVNELEHLKNKYEFLKNFAFDDDILPLNKNWFREFIKLYKEKVNVPYDCNIRPNLIDEEIVDLLQDSGCYQVRIGIETANEDMRKMLLKRNIDNEQLKKSFNLLKKSKIEIYTYNMVGLPGETPKMMYDTLELNYNLKHKKKSIAMRNQVTIFHPYKNTEIFDFCSKNGLIHNNCDNVTDYSQETCLKFDRIQKNNILFFQKYFNVLSCSYSFFDMLPEKIALEFKKALKFLILSKFFGFIFMPFLNSSMDYLKSNQQASKLFRRLYRNLIARKEK
ncbi:MAG: radical SAM protein [bacterium]